MKKILFLLIFFTGLYFSGRVLIAWDRPVSDSDERVEITVPPGASLQRISQILHQNDLIKDAWVFRLQAQKSGLASLLQAGDYVFQKNLTPSEILELLQSAKGKEMPLTLPEGFTIDQIDALLARKSLIEPGDFISCAQFCDLGFKIASLEGYLFPDTYHLNPQNFSAKSFIQKLYKNFQNKIEPLREEIQNSGRTLEEIVIMASMIEKEAAHKDEMNDISDVLWKRYDEGIALGVDATTRYELKAWDRPLYTEDFESDSPYNTRRIVGIPPTAISNPGLDSIRAALRPSSNPYYYYLHAPDGQIYFAETYDEHNQYKNKYLR